MLVVLDSFGSHRVTDERLNVLREADHIVTTEIEAAGAEKGLWQYFAVLLPVKSVGVMGDVRTYEEACALRIVQSEDGMTADWVQLPYDLLGRISSRVINEVRRHGSIAAAVEDGGSTQGNRALAERFNCCMS